MRTSLGTTPNVCFIFELGDGANKGVQKGSSTHYPILSTNPQGRLPVVLKIYFYILPHFVHISTSYVQDHTHTNHPDLRNIVAPPRTIRKWFRRLAFWILRTRAQDPCSCCCRPTPRWQDPPALMPLPDFFFFFFSCSADHEWDWPPCKVVFFGLATNALNVRNNKGLGVV